MAGRTERSECVFECLENRELLAHDIVLRNDAHIRPHRLQRRTGALQGHRDVAGRRRVERAAKERVQR